MKTSIALRIPQDLLGIIDAQAAADGVSRNRFFELAIKTRLANAPGISIMADPATHPVTQTSTWHPPHASTCTCNLCKLSKLPK